MKAHEELLYLKHVLMHMDADKPSILASRWLPPVTWLAACAFFIALFQLQHALPPAVFAGLACLVGIVLGALAFWRACTAKWPFVKPHLDRSSIVRRVRELES
ncbi:DUF4175 domain-containing protein [Novilysobacter spongiicola]|uniref:DUF4175 domain-containing protein n=1 Tax=Novilysobacter spongiicola TaxID=435289 RepID=UPI00117C9B77|nr:DUF4175 domain-containing protein [Lysobacter spongiicola]